MILRPQYNDITIDTERRTCVITSSPRQKVSYTNFIPQKDCVEIMTIMRQAGYTFDIQSAHMTRTFSKFFRN